jgi:DNA replication protein DnaC
MSVPTALEQKLAQLKLSRMAEVYAHWVKEAETQQWGYAEFLDGLLSEELVSRQESQMRRQLKAAGFPFAASLEQFDFSLHPELKRTVMVRFSGALWARTFVEQAQSLILVGASGLGKTHLAIALGTKMVQLGYRVRFVTAQRLANEIVAAPTRAAVTALLGPLIRCDLLILDEFGYLSVDPQVGPVLYELVAARYEQRATVITSNKSLSQWGDVVGGDTALMMAILDRLLHHGEVFYLRGASYRMRGKESLLVGRNGAETSAEPTVG